MKKNVTNLFEFETYQLKDLYAHIQSLVEKRLWLQVLISIFLGVGAGMLISPSFGWVEESISSAIARWMGFPGMLFLRLVQMIMIPLIFASIIQGLVANDNVNQLKRLGIGILVYFVGTTAVSIILGITTASIIQPGNYFDPTNKPATASGDAVPETAPAEMPSFSSIPDALTNIIPSNPLSSMVSGDMLSIVVFTIIVGVALAAISKKVADPLVDLLNAVQQVCMLIVNWAMKLVPLAVFGLMVQLVATTGFGSLVGISVFVASVLLGLFLLLFFYSIVLLFAARKNPLSFFAAIRDVQLLAFSTASSAAVMPLSIKTAEEKLQIKPAISNFIIPIGATINMDGTALFQCMATLFLAQIYGVEITMASMLIIVITIVAASIGTPAIPGGGVIVLASILEEAGIPVEGLVLIIGVDRILGMFRTAVNVTGDLTACTVFNKSKLFAAQQNGQPKPSEA
ncbi:MAG: C4-dicarboxylate transporter [Crocinitomicaceae bacterium]|nr:C4-dicarboxylate transporter [Crocinitomicaceae bacterium]